ncbi:MAG: Crp/Fnr family transcriptional regulator [Microscillaceae bacterium]|nr:Crp/Fnr family transcriptional regulator [Microscillaceae bacterium]
MMTTTATVLAKIGSFSENDCRLFEQKSQARNLPKGDFVLRPGEVCRSVYYILAGDFLQYNYYDEIELNVLDLHLTCEWFADYGSFIWQKPSQNFVQAYSDSQIWELSVENLHQLISLSPAFFQLGKILESSTSRLHFFDNRMTPTQKYQFILDHKPQLLQKFPLKIIASYLKISPETLSRVRESLAKGKIIS